MDGCLPSMSNESHCLASPSLGIIFRSRVRSLPCAVTTTGAQIDSIRHPAEVEALASQLNGGEDNDGNESGT